MRFKISSELSYNIRSATTFIFNIKAIQTKTQIIIEESIVTTPDSVTVNEFVLPNNSARLLRVYAGRIGYFKIQYNATVALKLKPVNISKSAALKIPQISDEALMFLYPSRYCQSDELFNFAYREFGHIKSTYQKVKSICNWINKNISYVIGSTNANTSAVDTIIQRQGVCRDFSHLGIVLCRALNIPARYFSGYAYQLNPPDFHACFEAFVDGRWILFDATGMVPLQGVVKIAHGNDASDTSFANIFGEADPINVIVDCQAVDIKSFEVISKKLKLVSFE